MSAEFLKDYFPIMLFLFLALGLSIGFIVLNFVFSPKNPDPEKLSAYECGFEPFEDARNTFDIRFYLVAILFILFDLEACFLFPWSVSLNDMRANLSKSVLYEPASIKLLSPSVNWVIGISVFEL